MRAVVQRVTSASVTIGGRLHAEIGAGLMVLAGFAPGDGERDLDWMAEKVAGLRIFEHGGKMNLSVQDVGGEVLVVPNFTLHGDCRKGRRPSFSAAAPPEQAARLFDGFCDLLARHVPVKRGVFGAHMHVALVNDGPVTILLESESSS